MIISVLFFVLVLGAAYMFQEKLIFVPKKTPLNFKYEFGGNWAERNYAVAGATLNAVHFKVDNPEGVVIYFHGNAGSLASWGYVG